MIIVRNKYLDIQVALRDMNIVPTHFVLIPEAGSHDNITKAVFERGDSPASAFWELGSQAYDTMLSYLPEFFIYRYLLQAHWLLFN